MLKNHTYDNAPLHVAEFFHPKTVALLRKGTKVNPKNDRGQTPLDLFTRLSTILPKQLKSPHVSRMLVLRKHQP